ncbi:MAG: acyl-CoA dehydrogenase family protein [Bdellovibrionota bacterium]
MSRDFYQNGPELQNQFRSDALLQSYLQHALPDEQYKVLKPELERLGERAASDLLELSRQAEREEPVHIPFDPWGKRIDTLRMSSAWSKITDAAAEEGIVATGYERKFGAHSRLAQFAKLYLFHASSAFVSCPLAMTDGAARALELYGDENLKEGAFRHLTSRDPISFWTSGQWMTERTGGSDVSGTSTTATPKGGDNYALTGTKWFTSATNSQMAMALARIDGHPEGGRGLSLFYIELRDQDGKLQNIEIHRLKDKLGTKGLPTAELSLHGTPAKLVGGEGGGIKKIASLFNITRLYNAVCALSAARRALVLAVDYSGKRRAFGKTLLEHPLHQETLADLTVEFEGNFLLTFHLADLLGKDETGSATAEESAVLRLLTPIAKLYTAKSCMAITSEVVEVFGGAGYIEDTGLPTLLRDAQVFSIWEGTTNVLSLDVIRAIEKENAFPPFIQLTLARVANLTGLDAEVAQVKAACGELQKFLVLAMKEGTDFVQAGARHFSYSLARTYCASLLLERASKLKDERSAEVARRWCRNGLTPLLESDSVRRTLTAKITAGVL